MNTTPSPISLPSAPFLVPTVRPHVRPDHRPRRGFPWNGLLVVFGTLATLAMVFMAVLVLSFRQGGEVRSLRHAVLAASPDTWKPTMEFGVGRLPAFLARTGLQLVDSYHGLDLPPEAKAVLAAFRSADIGLYKRIDQREPVAPSSLLSRVDGVMAEKDWDSVVSVMEGSKCIRVFVPSSMTSQSDARVCVLVLDGDDLVIASTRLNLEPFIELLEKGGFRWAPRLARGAGSD